MKPVEIGQYRLTSAVKMLYFLSDMEAREIHYVSFLILPYGLKLQIHLEDEPERP